MMERRRDERWRRFTFSGGDTVADLLMHYPDLSAVLIGDGVDTVASGDDSLDDCCARSGWHPDEMLERLALVARKPSWQEDEDWSQVGLQDLVDHIVARHHGYLAGELPRLVRLAGAIAARHPDAGELHRRLVGYAADVSAHLEREEAMLFPVCVELEHAAAHGVVPASGVLRVAVDDLETGHQTQADELPALSALLDQLADASGCAPFRAALRDGLDALADDLAEHHRKEEDYLLPAALHAQEVLSTGPNRLHPERKP